MALIEWDESLSVRVKQFDEEHQRLIGLLNQLHDAMSEGKGMQATGEVLDELARYTQTHFSHEEEAMERFDYPRFKSHQKNHEELTNKVVDLQKKKQEGAMFLSVEVLNFLKQWLTRHIQGSDMEYSEFFREKGLE